MPEPIRWRSKVILAEIEVTYGTDPTPAGDANAMLLSDVEFRPMEGEDVPRNHEKPFLGARETIPAGLHGILTASVELAPSGETGVAPAWGPLLRACGVAEVVTPDDNPGDGTVVYTPVSDEHESVTIHFWIGGTRHILTGCRGTGTVTVNAQGIPVFRATLTGLYSTPTKTSQPTIDVSAFKRSLIATKTNTPTFKIDGVSFVLREFGFNLGNDVQQRLLIGRESIEIVDRAEQISARVEAVPLDTWDPFTEAETSSLVAVELVHGTSAGNRFKFEADHCLVQRLSGFENSQNILEWPLALVPQPDEGDDQWTITLT